MSFWGMAVFSVFCVELLISDTHRKRTTVGCHLNGVIPCRWIHARAHLWQKQTGIFVSRTFPLFVLAFGDCGKKAQTFSIPGHVARWNRCIETRNWQASWYNSVRKNLITLITPAKIRRGMVGKTKGIISHNGSGRNPPQSSPSYTFHDKLKEVKSENQDIGDNTQTLAILITTFEMLHPLSQMSDGAAARLLSVQQSIGIGSIFGKHRTAFLSIGTPIQSFILPTMGRIIHSWKNDDENELHADTSSPN